jgi:serine/threonine-protein kinase
VYVANSRLYLRSLDELEAAPIRGTEGNSEAASPMNPFFSPDGQWVGFWQAGQLKKVSIAGGAPVVLCAAGRPSGASWGDDDTIVFSTGPEGIFRVPGAGGTPAVAVQVPQGDGALDVQILPHSHDVLYTLRTLTDATADQIVAQSLDGGAQRVVVQHGFDGLYLPTGHLLYVNAGTLVAVPFNRGTLTVSGAPVPLVEGVQLSLRSAFAQFNVSETGALVFMPAERVRRTLVWVDRQGGEELVPAEPRAYASPRISPDGTRVAVVLLQDQDQAVWVWNLAKASLTRLTFALRSDFPIWSPDGRYVLFRSNEGIQRQTVEGGSNAERLIQPLLQTFPDALTPDGKSLLVDQRDQKEQWDVDLVSMDGNHTSTALLTRPYNEQFAEVSPDGRWIAYQSNESGREEIYVRPFPKVDEARWQISSGGGRTPVWAHSGRELFYLSPEGRMMSVAVHGQPGFSAGTPTTLFERSYEIPNVGGRQFDVAPDGRRFLMMKQSDQTKEPGRLIVVENWFTELQQRVPLK